MDLRPSRDEYFMLKAWVTSLRSTCVRRAVGCVLVNGLGHDIGSGYNGRPAGLDHCNELDRSRFPDSETQRRFYESHAHEGGKWFITSKGDYVVDTYPYACKDAFTVSGSKPAGCEAVHAEMNAWNQCYDRLWVDTAYVTRSPCVPCTKVLMNTSCRRIVFATVSSDAEIAAELWLRSNKVKQSQPHIKDKIREWVYLDVPNPFQSLVDAYKKPTNLTRIK